jgi:hypothetical protein
VNHLPFGRALRRYLQSNRALELLPGCGWMDGGCLILREALIFWSEGTLHAGASIRSRQSRAYVDHGFAWLEDSNRRILLDGDGVQDVAGMCRKLERLEGVRPSEILFTADGLVVGIPIDTAASRALADRLYHRFGGFSIDLILQ